jgi:DNA-binding HxlR family transcriptional regulator
MDAMTGDAHDATYCVTFQTAIELIGKRWNGAIVAVLIDGPKRFSALATSVPGLSERLLSERLRELEARGLLVRHVISGPPLGVEYTLTQAGQELAPVVRMLSDWGHKWLDPREACLAADDALGAEGSELIPAQAEP